MAAALRNFIENSPTAKFQPEKGRYHLYVALSCPFAHRVLAAINLKGLQDFVDITVVHPIFQRTRPNDDSDTHTGWAFVDAEANPTIAGPTGVGKYTTRRAQLDPLHGASFIRDLYERVTKEPVRYSVPLLWDKKLDTIVSTESADMVRFFNSAFDELNPGSIDLYPEALRAEIDATNEWVTESINNGVYKVGFAQSQETYEAALANLYKGFDRVEAALAEHRYIVGNSVTEADVRLFVTLIRFDEAYALRYNANKKLLREYHNIFNYLKDFYQLPGIAATVDFEHIRFSYFGSSTTLNPHGIIPVGPAIDYSTPHDRARF